MQLADVDLAAAAAATVRGEVSPVEMVESCLARIERLEPHLRAFVHVDADGALRRARRLADVRPRGILHGIPLGIKDLADVAGLPTTASSKVLAGNVAATDAPLVARLLAAGAIVIGKTNTQEFAYGVVSPPTRNPWDLGRIPGGSSGGSAAAVAAGECPGALGTDTAGSIRIPSALCGITGLMARPQTLPMEGVIPLAWTLDAAGPMARTAADVVLMWEALAGAPSRAVARIDVTVASPRVDAVDGEVAAAVEAAVDTLCRHGAARVDAPVPSLARWDAARSVPLMVEALAAHIEAGWFPQRSDLYTDETRAYLRHAQRFSAVETALAGRDARRLAGEFATAVARADVVVLPSTAVAAPTYHEAEAFDEHGHRRIRKILTRITGPINWCGLAAVSVPCGFTADGLPIGMQIVARDEDTALSVALAYQEVTDFHRRRPPAAA